MTQESELQETIQKEVAVQLQQLPTTNLDEQREKNLDDQITIALSILGIMVVIMTGGSYWLASVGVDEPSWAATTISTIVGFVAGHFTNSRTTKS